MRDDSLSLFHDPEVQLACEALFALIEAKMAARGDVFLAAGICVAGAADGYYCDFGDASDAAQEALADVMGQMLGEIVDDLDRDEADPDDDAADADPSSTTPAVH